MLEMKPVHPPPRCSSSFKSELMFLEEKYERIKKKMYQKKLLQKLTEADVEEIGNAMNVIAMKYSQDGQQKVAEDWLKRSLKYCEYSSKMKVITYNNMACVYRQANNLPLALLYISKAQKQADWVYHNSEEDKIVKVVTDCSLNLCAILSSMGEHSRALKAVRKAQKLLEFTKQIPASYYNSLYPLVKYNEAVELERLKMYSQARECYESVLKTQGASEQLRKRVCQALGAVKQIEEKSRRGRDNSKKYSSVKLSRDKQNLTCSKPSARKILTQRKRQSERNMIRRGEEEMIYCKPKFSRQAVNPFQSLQQND